MNDRPMYVGRRRFVVLGGAGVAAASLSGTLFVSAAHAADTLSETDPTAAALGYKVDAGKAAARKDPTAVCGGCALYAGKPGDANGPCSVFGGRLVSAKGWCTAWAKKT
jgi:hypothetical protein